MLKQRCPFFKIVNTFLKSETKKKKCNNASGQSLIDPVFS